MRRLASVILMGILLTACGDPFSPEGVSGVYNLESINGSPIPFSETETQDGVTITVEVTAGSVTLNTTGTWSLSITASFTIGSITTGDTETESGTFELVPPSTIRLTDSDGDTISATLDGDGLTVTDGGDTFVFHK